MVGIRRVGTMHNPAAIRDTITDFYGKRGYINLPLSRKTPPTQTDPPTSRRKEIEHLQKMSFCDLNVNWNWSHNAEHTQRHPVFTHPAPNPPPAQPNPCTCGQCLQCTNNVNPALPNNTPNHPQPSIFARVLYVLSLSWLPDAISWICAAIAGAISSCYSTIAAWIPWICRC
ncbi:hypothetical protein CPB86DRAFT_175313 [Serendipita vermifera]|nr:hypothetical protein CPB86DRAFT_175313 [Serendipita vermifera]